MKASSKKPRLTTYERYLLSALAYGMPVGKLPAVLNYYSQEPTSISSVDKNLRKLREKYNCATNEQLVYVLRNRVIKLDLENLKNE